MSKEEIEKKAYDAYPYTSLAEEYRNSLKRDGYIKAMTEIISSTKKDCPEYCVRSHCIGCPIYEKQEEPEVYASETMTMKDNIDRGFTRMMEKEYNKTKWSRDDIKHFDTIINDVNQGVCPDEDDMNWFKNRFRAVINQTSTSRDEKIHGWVARDFNNDPFLGDGLIVHKEKPERNGNCWSSNTIMFHLPWEYFPELKWEDEPIEVEITISKRK